MIMENANGKGLRFDLLGDASKNNVSGMSVRQRKSAFRVH
jgi:hypothetical protein